MNQEKKTVVFSQAIHDDAMRAVSEKHTIHIAESTVTTDYLDQLREAEALVLRLGVMSREIIESCPKLEVIAWPGVGVDTIDVVAATEHGIPVVVTPGASTRSVAEHTMALLYAIAKNIPESNAEIRKGNYGIRSKGVAVDLHDRVVGIVGFGNIGRATARLMRNNGMTVKVYDPYVTREAAEEVGCSYEPDLYTLLGDVDVISLHLPSLPETRHMLGKMEFAAMKEGMLFLNCARGDVVVEDALYAAMLDGTVAAAAVDVMEAEPMDPANPLFNLPNFVATAHSAAQSREAYKRVSDMVAGGVLATLAGEKWTYVCNPQVYTHKRWK